MITNNRFSTPKAFGVEFRKQTFTRHVSRRQSESNAVTLTDKIKAACAAPQPLTLKRIIAAIAIALVADGLQIPFQAVPLAPEIIDVIAMAFTTWLLGFHLLLLPTFAVEFIPVVDMLPTWTGCVMAVIALRKRSEKNLPTQTTTPEPPKIAATKQEGSTLPKP